MRKPMLMAAAGVSALVLGSAAPAGAAATAPTASCEGAFASYAATFGPGTVAELTHLLQQEADGTPTGLLNRVYAQSKGDCFSG
jgi:hypothetical protein